MFADRLPPPLSPPTATPRRVDRKVLRFLHDPAQPCGGVFDGGGEFVLGRKPVIDRDDAASRDICDLSADVVVGIEIADDVAATMIEYEDGKRSRPGADPAVEP